MQIRIKQREKGWGIQYLDCMANTSLQQVYKKKTTIIKNIYYCQIINGSYMVWRGKV